MYAFAHEFYRDFRWLTWGYSRQQFDRSRYDRKKEQLEKESRDLTEEERERYAWREEQIRNARLPPAEKEKRLEALVRGEMWAKFDAGLTATDIVESSMRRINEPGKPEIVHSLLGADTAEQIRKICEEAYRPYRMPLYSFELGCVGYHECTILDWPIANGSTLPIHLSNHAEQFLTAKNEPRFPRSNRPSSRSKQLWFLSCALAGAVFGIQTRTAINLIGSKRPEYIFSNKSRRANRLRVTKSGGKS